MSASALYSSVQPDSGLKRIALDCDFYVLVLGACD